VNSLNEVMAVIEENNNIRIALYLCIDKLSETIDEAKEKWGERVLIVLCDKHYPSNFDTIHYGIVTRDIDLCSNGEWESIVHIALADKCKVDGCRDQAKEELSISKEIKRRRYGQPQNSVEISDT
jgi:hypothetical protein